MTPQYYEKSKCRYCESPLPAAFLEMGAMALANSYVKQEDRAKPEFTCPLSLTWCPQCGLVQLTHVVRSDVMFKNYLYVSSTTKTFRDHFAQYAAQVKGKLIPEGRRLAVDIGSNDGYLVQCYQNEGMTGLGIDPAENLAKAANEKGIKTLNRFFDEACVEIILKDYGKAHVVSANNVFAHIDDIHAVLRNVSRLLDERGMFVVEFPYLVTMMDELLFDMIYHEHLSYIGVHPLRYVMNRFGFEIFDIDFTASHGGSLRVFTQKKGGPYRVEKRVQDYLDRETRRGCLTREVYLKFAEEVNATKRQFMAMIRGLQSAGKSIAGYGAPAKASTIINFYGLHHEDIRFVADDNPLKQGYLTPGAKIPIVASAHLFENPTDYVVIFAWNFAREIMGKVQPLKEKGVQFLVPVTGAAKNFSKEESRKNELVFAV